MKISNMKVLMAFLCVFVILFSLVLVCASAEEQLNTDEKIINVYLIAGQSNAVGYGNGAPNSDDPRFTEGFDNVIYYGLQEKNEVTEFVPVKVGLGKDSSSVGAEIGIASAVADNGQMNAIIKCAWGNTHLYPDLASNRSKTTGTYTPPGYVEMANSDPDVADVDTSVTIESGDYAGEAIVGNMYRQFIKYVTEGITMLREDGYTPVIKGIWWMQGEAEIYNGTMSNGWGAVLNYLIPDMRRDVGNIVGTDCSDIPFVMGLVARNGGIDYSTGETYSQPKYIEIVRDAMKTAAETFTNVYTIECRGLAQLDEWHFTSDAQKWLGEQFVEAVSMAEGFEITEYGKIPSAYANVDTYPFAVFTENCFLGAYSTLADAVDASEQQSGKNIILLRKNTVVDDAPGSCTDVILDLDGYTLTAGNTVFCGGNIVVKGGTIAIEASSFIDLTSDSSICIEGCTLNLKNSENGAYVINAENAKSDIRINGGIILANNFSRDMLCKSTEDENICFNKLDSSYTKLVLPLDVSFSKESYTTDKGEAEFLVLNRDSESVTYTLGVLNMKGYGVIPDDYSSLEDYPFAVFYDGAFLSAHAAWSDAAQAVRSKTYGSANENRTGYVVLRRDYIVTTRFANVSQIGGTLVLDLNGYSMVTDDHLFDANAKTVGTSDEICDTFVKVINGNILIKDTAVIRFNRNSNYISEKTFYFTFDNVVFGLTDDYITGASMICSTGTGTATAISYADMLFTNCVFDLRKLSGTNSVILFNYKDSHDAINISSTVSGCMMLADEIDHVTFYTYNAENDSLVFSKNDNGEYFKLCNNIIHATAPSTTIELLNEDGVYMTFAFESLENGNAVYVLKEGLHTKYGPISAEYSDVNKYPFALFMDGEFKGAYTHWANTDDNDTNNGGSADNYDVLQQAKGLIHGADGAGKTVYIMLRRDYALDSTEYSVKDGTKVNENYGNFSQVGGTLVVDLGGNSLTLGAEQFLNAEAKLTSSVAHDSAMKFMNGTIELNSQALINYKSNSKLTSSKSFDFEFENVTFVLNENTKGASLVSQGSFSGTANVFAKIDFIDCTFDYSKVSAANAAVTLFDLNDAELEATVTVKGGRIMANEDSFSAITLASLGKHGSVIFTADKNGSYVNLYMPEGETVARKSIPTDLGDKYFIRTGKVELESEAYAVYSLADKAFTEYAPKMSITLHTQLTLNVYSPAECTERFAFNGIKYENLNSYNTVTLSDGMAYYHVYASLASANAASEIKLTASVKIDGKSATASYTFSIPKYAAKLIANGNETEKTLAKDVLAYIKAAYEYFGTDHNTAEEIARVTALIDSIIGEYNAVPTASGVTNTVAPVTSVTLNLDAQPTIRFYVTDTAVSFYQNGKKLNTVSGVDSEYGVYIELDVYAYALAEAITYGDGGSYHISDFVNGSKGTAHEDLVNAFVKYVESAAAYRNSVVKN